MKQLIEGNLAAIDFIKTNPAKAEEYTADRHREGVRQADRPGARDRIVQEPSSSRSIPIPSSLVKDAKDAYDVGLIDSADVKGIYDLKLLNEILKDTGEPTIKG